MVRKFSLSVFALALAMILAAPDLQAESVGRVRLVKEWAYESLMPGDWDDLFIEDAVFSNQRIRTPANAAVHVRLADGADFRVGARSEVVIDKFVYDPSKGAGTLITTLGKGAFRFISGKVKNYEIRTPSATVGIRGTDIIVAVLANNDTVMQVNQGAAEMTPCSSTPARRFECLLGAKTVVMMGETAGVVFGGSTVVKGVEVPYAPGLDDDAGLASLNTQSGGFKRFDTSFAENDHNENTVQPEFSNVLGTAQSGVVVSPIE
jgi:hypothetical protein